jgi:hypothetical protein
MRHGGQAASGYSIPPVTLLVLGNRRNLGTNQIAEKERTED